MATIVEEEDIPGSSLRNKVMERSLDVGTCRLPVLTISIDEDGDVGFSKPKPLDEALMDAIHIVDATVELSFGSRVVAPH